VLELTVVRPGDADGAFDPADVCTVTTAQGDLLWRGRLGTDTVFVDRAILLDDAPGDSLNAPAELSLATCGPPTWIGTVHTHVRSTDDPAPAPRFSGSDRVVMSVWSVRWRSKGAFCVLYSDRGAHCEVYPPGRPALLTAPGTDTGPASVVPAPKAD
jgi:hypothetical protein